VSTPPPAPAQRRRTARILTILFSVVVLGAVGLFIGQSFIPLPGVSDCTVTAIEESEGRRGNDITLYRTSCGDYYTDNGRGIEVGGTYDFELRGLFKTNIAGWKPSA
jgi:hypothetical protein